MPLDFPPARSSGDASLRADDRRPEIFKAYDVRGLYGEQIDGDVAEQIGRAFARVLADLAGKAAGRAAHRPRAATCASPRPSWARATARAWSPRARTCSTPGWSAPRCSTSSSARAGSTAG